MWTQVGDGVESASLLHEEALDPASCDPRKKVKRQLGTFFRLTSPQNKTCELTFKMCGKLIIPHKMA